MQNLHIIIAILKTGTLTKAFSDSSSFVFHSGRELNRVIVFAEQIYGASLAIHIVLKLTEKAKTIN